MKKGGFATNKYSDVVPFYTEGDPFGSIKIDNLEREIKGLKESLYKQIEKAEEYRKLVIAWENSDIDFIRERTRWSKRNIFQKEQINRLMEDNLQLRAALSYEEKLTRYFKTKVKDYEVAS